MTMVTLAERLHLHPSTVSRATREKYLQCRQGTYPCLLYTSPSPRARRTVAKYRTELRLGSAAARKRD